MQFSSVPVPGEGEGDVADSDGDEVGGNEL